MQSGKSATKTRNACSGANEGAPPCSVATEAEIRGGVSSSHGSDTFDASCDLPESASKIESGYRTPPNRKIRAGTTSNGLEHSPSSVVDMADNTLLEQFLNTQVHSHNRTHGPEVQRESLTRDWVSYAFDQRQSSGSEFDDNYVNTLWSKFLEDRPNYHRLFVSRRSSSPTFNSVMDLSLSGGMANVEKNLVFDESFKHALNAHTKQLKQKGFVFESDYTEFLWQEYSRDQFNPKHTDGLNQMSALWDNFLHRDLDKAAKYFVPVDDRVGGGLKKGKITEVAKNAAAAAKAREAQREQEKEAAAAAKAGVAQREQEKEAAEIRASLAVLEEQACTSYNAAIKARNSVARAMDKAKSQVKHVSAQFERSRKEMDQRFVKLTRQAKSVATTDVNADKNIAMLRSEIRILSKELALATVVLKNARSLNERVVNEVLKAESAAQNVTLKSKIAQEISSSDTPNLVKLKEEAEIAKEKAVTAAAEVEKTASETMQATLGVPIVLERFLQHEALKSKLRQVQGRFHLGDIAGFIAEIGGGALNVPTFEEWADAIKNGSFTPAHYAFLGSLVALMLLSGGSDIVKAIKARKLTKEQAEGLGFGLGAKASIGTAVLGGFSGINVFGSMLGGMMVGLPVLSTILQSIHLATAETSSNKLKKNGYGTSQAAVQYSLQSHRSFGKLYMGLISTILSAGSLPGVAPVASYLGGVLNFALKSMGYGKLIVDQVKAKASQIRLSREVASVAQQILTVAENAEIRSKECDSIDEGDLLAQGYSTGDHALQAQRDDQLATQLGAGMRAFDTNMDYKDRLISKAESTDNKVDATQKMRVSLLAILSSTRDLYRGKLNTGYGIGLWSRGSVEHKSDLCIALIKLLQDYKSVSRRQVHRLVQQNHKALRSYGKRPGAGGMQTVIEAVEFFAGFCELSSISEHQLVASPSVKNLIDTVDKDFDLKYRSANLSLKPAAPEDVAVLQDKDQHYLMLGEVFRNEPMNPAALAYR